MSQPPDKQSLYETELEIDKTTKLATALEGYAALDAEEADALVEMFIETTRKAIERRMAHRLRH